MAEVDEVIPSLSVVDENNETKTIRVFRLSLNRVVVEISSVGASITKILLPNEDGSRTDDITLGYKSPAEMFSSGNPPFLGVVVGRVANRIAKGKFQLDGNSYSLELNNGPNHLHGGSGGFNRRLWEMEMVDVPMGEGGKTTRGVRCTLQNQDGDQGYPGTVLVTATYSLQPKTPLGAGAALRLDMKAHLQDEKATPINLAQHTYFNLAGHNDPHGILDHTVRLACPYYTPNDATSIPTRRVVAVKDDPAMDLTGGVLMREALKGFATKKAGLTEEEAFQHQSGARIGATVAKSGPKDCLTPGEPYGFDHNYVVDRTSSPSENLNLVGTIEHEASRRRMLVYTSAPGVQVYTGNYLDGVNPDAQICKDGAVYGQWQGMCLETQHFPDSILSPEEETEFPEFASGKCHILRPGSAHYEHTVEYRFEQIVD
ncbi:Aldose 1-epimerase [Seminavis robusta]|uniref:Aldose 1-epimerase n=1 Tax=Seminavis robusta TaxID=568900 RepID=A0A9N8EZ20_9STRA|nr:Aldose 1-epimerase [Seminavis robusta]|eukprot:Sro2197_g318670.1 Aldose 1-epimerase (429) ;mRNA; f:4977-6263